METVELRTLEPGEAQGAADVMLDALSIPERLWQIINDPHCTTYAAYQAGDLVAASIVRWGDESEIEVLAVTREKRRQGIGQVVVARLIEEAKSRGAHTLFVGTSSIALDNILFYQKCGLRMSHIRRNYFTETYPELHIEWRGIKLRDMVVFDYAFSEQ